MDSGNLHRWSAAYLSHDLLKRNCCWVYCWFSRESNGAEWIFLSFVSVLPQNILLIPAYLVIGTCAIAFSIRLIGQLFMKNHQSSTRPVVWPVCICSADDFSACCTVVFFESYISFMLMKKLAGVLYNCY